MKKIKLKDIEVQEPKTILKSKGIEAALHGKQIVIKASNQFIDHMDNYFVFDNKSIYLFISAYEMGLIECNTSTNPKGETVFVYDGTRRDIIQKLKELQNKH